MEENKKNLTLEERIEDFLTTYEDKLKSMRADNEQLTDRKIDALKADMKSEMDTYYKEVRKNNVSVPGCDDGNDKDKFSFAKACTAIINNDWREAGFEKEVCDAAHEKAVDTNTGGQGGFLIPTELANDKLIKPALAETVLAQLGMKVWNGLTDDLAIPEATSRPTLVFAADGAAQSAQNISFAQKYLRPKHGGMLVQISNNLLKQANVAEQIVRDLMMEGLTNGIDEIGLNGKGNDSEPEGILVSSDLTTATAIGANGGRLEVDKVAQMIADVEDNDYLKVEGSGGLLVHPRVKSGLKRERVAQYSGDTSGQPLIHPLMTNKMLEETLGLKIRSSTNVPNNIAKGSSTTLAKAVVGEWQKYAMGIWGGMRLKTSDQAGTAFASNQTWIVAFVSLDTLVLKGAAFSVLADTETTEASW